MRRLLLIGLCLGALASPAWAVDHNNIDAGRPLSFDDAESLAYREQSLEMGLNARWPRHRSLGLGLDTEYLYGFGLNSHLSVGLSPSVGGRSGVDGTSFDVGDVSLGVFHNFNREFGNTPALALRGDVFLPSGFGSRGADFRLRGIASKHAGQYGRVHLNLDLNAATDPGRGERTFFPGLTLGFTHPIGYPRRFTTTGLAEISVQSGPQSGRGPVLGIGLGVRRQVGIRSVVDLGIHSDLAGFNGAARDRIRLIAGYSYGF
jgi:hypothetical protein